MCVNVCFAFFVRLEWIVFRVEWAHIYSCYQILQDVKSTSSCLMKTSKYALSCLAKKLTYCKKCEGMKAFFWIKRQIVWKFCWIHLTVFVHLNNILIFELWWLGNNQIISFWEKCSKIYFFRFFLSIVKFLKHITIDPKQSCLLPHLWACVPYICATKWYTLLLVWL